MGDADTCTVDAALVVGEGEALVNALLAEGRIASTPSEEVLEGVPKLHNRHLRCALGDVEHPRELHALNGVQLAAERHLGWWWLAWVSLVRLVLLLPFGQHPVVGEAGATGSAGEIGRLRVVWVERDAVRD